MNVQPRRGVIVVDFDGTICEHRFPDFSAPIADVQQALQKLKHAGFWITIHTVRSSSVHELAGMYDPEVNIPEAVGAYLERHDIPFDEIWAHDKPVAIAYIDDRGLRLVGDRKRSNWEELVNTLLGGPATKPLVPPRKRRFFW